MFIPAAYHFLQYLRAVKNSSEHTIRSYATDINSLKSFMEDHYHGQLPKSDFPPKIDFQKPYLECRHSLDNLIIIASIDRKTIREFLAHLYNLKQQKRTVARRLCALRTFFTYCCSQKLISSNPTEEIETPKFDKMLPHPLTYEQVVHLFTQPDTSSYLGVRDRTILELFYSSGLRINELASLDRENFDADSLLIKLKGKGKKERIVPITKNAATWILSYLNASERFSPTQGHYPEQDHEAIFLNCLGTRLTTRSIDRSFKQYITASGLAGKATPHTIRHTIATHWLENGMDLKTIQLLLGHSTLATTTIYTHVSSKLKKQTHQKAHPRG